MQHQVHSGEPLLCRCLWIAVPPEKNEALDWWFESGEFMGIHGDSLDWFEGTSTRKVLEFMISYDFYMFLRLNVGCSAYV